MNLLFVDCCLSQRGADSRTKALCDAYLQGYQLAHPHDTITHLDLATLDLQPFDVSMLNSRQAQQEAQGWDHPMFALARQFATAQAIVVGAPYWDLSFPALLRIYIEHISCVGLTYYYDETGCHGSCQAKKLVYLTTGGDFQRDNSLGIAHWQALCSMFGIAQFASVFAGGLDIDPSKTQELLDLACAQAQALER